MYRATDTKLNRDVALKFLPAPLASEPGRLERFQREAHVLASLNHFNIGAIYGLEDSASTPALVMELIDGPTLADRITGGPIPCEEVLPVAKQIADALEYAHERGIVHRDLKPANIKLTADGLVKVLDFGLAKAIAVEPQAMALSNSPTLSLAATQAGVILGTAAYMSPEQAKGKTVDRRADIWAFGVVVYEMLTGNTMFAGETASEIMAQVIMKEPDWTALPAATPERLRELLRRCLTKDPRSRLRDIGDARIALEELIAHPEPQVPVEIQSSKPAFRQGSRLPWIVAATLALILAVIVWAPWRTPPPAPAVARLTVEVGADVSLVTGTGAAAFLSPDGKVLAFLAAQAPGQRAQIYLRRLDQLQALPLAGTEGARNAFFSTDGQWIGFFADRKLKKISVNGGSAVTLCDAEEDRGGAWGDDGSIVFSPNTRSGLFRVSSAGGKPEPLTKLDSATNEITQRWPQVLPGSDVVLFVASSTANNYEDAKIVAQSIRTGERRIIPRPGHYPRYVASGHLLYMSQATLFGAPFDIQKLELTGEPAPVVEGVLTSPNNGSAQFAISESGAMVYVAGSAAASGTQLLWLPRDGKTQPLRSVTSNYVNPRFSPDGNQIAFDLLQEQFDTWTYDWKRDAPSRLTFDPMLDRRPVWTNDSRRIAFSSQRADKAVYNLYWQRADGTGEPQRLTESRNNQFAMSWHPGGKILAFAEASPQTNYDILMLPIDGDESSGWKVGKPTTFLATFFQEREPAFSPDGRWIAYQSNEGGGDYEIYVRSFPGPGGKWQVSNGGGEFPTWSRNGRELFYRASDSRIMVVPYAADGDTFRALKPELWSDFQFANLGPLNRYFDLHPDGRRFAVVKSAEATPESRLNKVTFILNFFEELRRLAPAAR